MLWCTVRKTSNLTIRFVIFVDDNQGTDYSVTRHKSELKIMFSKVGSENDYKPQVKYFEESYVGRLIRKVFEIYNRRKWIFCAPGVLQASAPPHARRHARAHTHRVIVKRPSFRYDGCYIPSTAQLALSAGNEEVEGEEKQGGRLQQVANALFHEGGDWNGERWVSDESKFWRGKTRKYFSDY